MIDQKIDTPGIEQGNLHKNPDTSVLEHFVPIVNEGVSIQRDRFGNRIFKSPSFSYYDREGRETKAALLISPEGEEFIKANRSILKDIARGLKDLDSRFDPQADDQRLDKLIAENQKVFLYGPQTESAKLLARFKSESRLQPLARIDLGNGRKMEIPAGTFGRQSRIHILTIGSEKYVIKIRKTIEGAGRDFSQPYINEMLQCQAIAVDLKPQLDQAGIEMARFLFASGQISCSRFEEGAGSTFDELKPKARIFLPALYDYIEKQHVNGISLWRNVKQDIGNIQNVNSPNFYIATHNFITRKDGKFVCIDPLAYFDIQSEK